MEQPLVSVIIPIYKVEKYLRRCLDSIKDQTYRNIEVIMVDDGSSDGCPAICDEYAAKDKRFRVIHKENGGVDSARNVGIDNISSAGGGYICFVDSDDWLPRQAIEKLEDRIEKTKADFVYGNWYKMFISGKKAEHACVDRVISCYDSQALTDALLVSFAPWGSLYRAELLKQHKLYFPCDMKINEDNFFVLKYLQNCRTIATVSDCVYYYNRLNDTSITKRCSLDHNACFARSFVEREKLFYGSQTPAHEYFVMLEYFFAGVEQYVFYLSHEEAVDKIKESCMIYKPYFTNLRGLEAEYADNHFVKKFIDIKSYIEEENYEGIYQYLSSKKLSAKNNRSIKNTLIKTALPIEELAVFRLKLFYH